jgi:cytidine deaminase
MRCHICNADLPKPSFNRDHEDFDPCGTCLEVINNVFHDEPLTEEEMIEVEATPEELMEVVEDEYYGARE